MVPERIGSNFPITNEKNDKEFNIVEGKLTCCGQNSFAVETTVKIQGKFRPKPIPDNENMILAATCTKCGKRMIVFDHEKDGYDRQVKDFDNVRDIVQDSQENSLEIYACNKCGSEAHSVTVKYEYSNPEEFKNLDLKDETNAYSWIVVSLCCSNCGNKIKDFFDMETA